MIGSEMLIFALSTGSVTLATAVTLAVLRPPLRPLLAELCGGRARGDAWATLISLCALLGATAASTLPDGALLTAGAASAVGSPITATTATAPSAASVTRASLLGAAAQCALGLAGVLLSLGVTGAALFVYIRRSSACDLPAEGTRAMPAAAVARGGGSQ